MKCVVASGKHFNTFFEMLIAIYASNVAAAIGENPYQSANAIAAEIKGFRRDQYAALLGQEMVKAGIGKLADQRIDGCPGWENFAGIKALAQKALPLGTLLDRNEFVRRLTSEVYKCVGIRNKPKILRRFLDELKDVSQTIENPSSVTMYLPIPGHNSCFKISGRANALIFEDNTKSPIVIQVRSRQNELYDEEEIPLFETVQIQLYLLLYKSEKCYFRQQFGEETSSITILADEDRQQQILKKLETFALESLFNV